LTGVDRDGADLRRDGVVARLDFPAPVNDLDAVRQSFVALAQSAKRVAMSQ
jgi:putative heme iron utilization protein